MAKVRSSDTKISSELLSCSQQAAGATKTMTAESHEVAGGRTAPASEGGRYKDYDFNA
jgi:hypothetical protein